MKVVVNTAMMGDKIVDLLCGYNENGVEFKFIQKTGMKLEFEASNIDGAAASSLIKTLIRDTEFGKALYFTVVV